MSVRLTRRIVLCALSIPAAMTACTTISTPGMNSPSISQEAVNSNLLDRYVAAANAHDTNSFPELFAETYIQHSGRSASGLVAQTDNARRLRELFPDYQVRVEDRVIAGGRVVARCTYTATHDHPFRGFPPTGKQISFATIDIWRIENGKFAEHWDLIDNQALNKQLSGK